MIGDFYILDIYVYCIQKVNSIIKSLHYDTSDNLHKFMISSFLSSFFFMRSSNPKASISQNYTFHVRENKKSSSKLE
jgi:hypothetical protein